jgi:hypothetical protein
MEYSVIYNVNLRAYLLMDGLLELLVVEDGPDLAVAIGAPERCYYLHLGLAHVNPEHIEIIIKACEE